MPNFSVFGRDLIHATHVPRPATFTLKSPHSGSHRGFKIAVKKSEHRGMFATLLLDDGTVMEGEGFGHPGVVFGEAVFNTGMVGYTETLTDPSYGGQILSITYPLVGNYGVPDPAETDPDGIPAHFESSRIQVRGLAVHDLSYTASHWNLAMTLDEWMYSQGIPGIAGVDTRSLTKRLRSQGVQMSALAVSESPVDSKELAERLASAARYDAERLVDGVSAAGHSGYGQGRNVVVLDVGAKNAILRHVTRMGYRAVRVPHDTDIAEIMGYEPAGVVISNGPGDPQHCTGTIRTARALMDRGVPMLGICLGAQIIALAGNAQTYKLKYGHRGQNKSCLDVSTETVYVTSQNHGYAISPDSLANSEFDLWFTNTDDDTVEGIRHRTRPCIAVQFHPEASPGPYDCGFVFEELHRIMEDPRPAEK